MAGYGLQKRTVGQVGGRESSGWDTSWRLELNFSGGYNGEKFFSGINFGANKEFYVGEAVEIGSTIGEAMLFVGGHF